MTSDEAIFLLLSGLMFLGIAISLAGTWHAMFAPLDRMLAGTETLPERANWLAKPVSYQQRLMIVLQLTGLIVFQKSAIQSGSASVEQIRSIPQDLQRRLKLLFWVNVAIGLLMAILVIAIKAGWIER